MKPLRLVVIVLFGLALLLLLYAYYLKPRVPQIIGVTSLPVNLQTMIPASWTVLPAQFQTCDFDNDGEDEYLILYSYDQAVETKRGLIGGAIYDTRVNRVPQAPGVEAPYRPAFLTPYKLLPDLYGGKGQGYLGQNSVTVYTLPPTAASAKCQAREIMVYGYSYDAAFPTTLSVFRWEGEMIGYVGWHIQGNVRLRAYDAAHADDSSKATAADNSSKAAVGVRAYNQLNQRSLLCAVQHYRRTSPGSKEDLPPGLDFTEVKTDYTIDFCYGAPVDPAYPEGVVMALLRGQNPLAETTPTGASYLTAEAQSTLPPELAGLKVKDNRKSLRVLSVTTPGSLGWYPPQGTQFTWTPGGGTAAPTPEVWWRSGQTAPVETEVVLNDGTGQVRQIRWTLVSLANEKANADTHWRITQIELR